VGVSGIAWALKLVCFCGFANFLITVYMTDLIYQVRGTGINE
jgi:energy-converting hydrogenase Eha subunit G